jgi:hypothetical protein
MRSPPNVPAPRALTRASRAAWAEITLAAYSAGARTSRGMEGGTGAGMGPGMGPGMGGARNSRRAGQAMSFRVNVAIHCVIVELLDASWGGVHRPLCGASEEVCT